MNTEIEIETVELTNSQRNAKITAYLDSLNIENFYCPSFDDDAKIKDFDALIDLLEEAQSFEVEIIYYWKAMEYLQANDNSLRTSIDLAVEMGFELKNINSELLASLLASENLRNEFYEYRNKITIEVFIEGLK
jgi:hypothetical protein